MYYDGKIWIGKAGDEKVCILPKMANRHGLIAGATGTGKTITLKVLAESFSDAGVPVFLADIKGDLSGMVRPGADTEDMQKRIARFGLAECGFTYKAFPSVFWDVYQNMGIPVRTTISEIGPVLLSKLMELNTTQTNILQILFRLADDNGLLLVDIKDLKAMLQWAYDSSKELTYEYGNITKQSISAIMRHVVALESLGGEKFFMEKALDLTDFFQTSDGKGVINILDSRQLVNDPTLYSVFLLWMLSELFDKLPEVGDPEKPRMVFFFDEAHLLFNDISKALQDKLEQIIKLIRSKGVGVYFITQSPRDIPDAILAQLGNKIQHALRAYTPAEMKAIKAAADSFRVNPAFDTAEVLQQLGTGEAVVSVLDEKGIPTMAQQTKILPPQSLMGPIPDESKVQEYKMNNLYLKYQEEVDPESAYEVLNRLAEKNAEEAAEAARLEAEEKERLAQEKEAAKEAEKQAKAEAKAAERAEREAAKQAEREAKAAAKEEERRRKAGRSVAKSVTTTAAGTVGREVGGSLGSVFGGKFGKKLGANLGGALGRSILGTLFRTGK